MTPTYRADIDGLRAVAVVAAILFHAGIPHFDGGYIGVDVFFVISGYLITVMIVDSSAQPPLQLLGWFYLRRCRRILPALLTMMTLTALACLILMPPQDLTVAGTAGQQSRKQHQ
jgi:peptidoglycan/LPS O-acetylase OafA/YrhL